jgi:ankyrin repeat protein
MKNKQINVRLPLYFLVILFALLTVAANGQSISLDANLSSTDPRAIYNQNSDIFETAYQGNIDRMRRLLSSGADINSYSNEGFTPLMEACSGGHLNMVQFLVENGADPNLMGFEGLTALRIAENMGHTDIVNYLQSLGASSSGGEATFNNERYTVVFCSATNIEAAENVYWEVIEVMPEYLFFLELSDNIEGMNPGYWVVFSQGYDDRSAANQLVQEAQASGLDCYLKDLGR